MAHAFTVHHRPGRDLRLVADRFSWLGLVLPPLWAVWQGLWFTCVMMLSALIAGAMWGGPGVLAIWIALALIAAWEGGSLMRAELGLLRWREVGMVLAETEEGAEELYYRGQAG